MSYQTIKNYLARIMVSNSFFEAKKKLNFEETGENFNNNFIVENPATDLSEGDTITDKFFPKRKFTVTVARSISEMGVQYEYDGLQAKVEKIVRDVHNPVNYRADSIKRVQWDNTETSIVGDYIVAVMTFIADDSLSYA